MKSNPENDLPLGLLVERYFKLFLCRLAQFEGDRQIDGRFSQKDLGDVRRVCRLIWKFLTTSLWENKEFQRISEVDFPATEDSIFWWKRENSGKERKISFRYLDYIFQVSVEENFLEKVVVVGLRRKTDSGEMDFKSRLPMSLTTLESDGLAF